MRAAVVQNLEKEGADELVKVVLVDKERLLAVFLEVKHGLEDDDLGRHLFVVLGKGVVE